MDLKITMNDSEAQFRANCLELLKTGFPTSKAIENLRAKIEQQKLDKISLESSVEPKHQHMTRKICRVSSKGGKIASGSVVSTPQRASLPRKHHMNRAPQAAAPKKKEHRTYISAWRDAQKLVKEVLDSQAIPAVVSQKDPNKNHSAKSIQTNHQHSAALTIQSHSKQRTYRSYRTERPGRCPTGKYLPLPNQTTTPPAKNKAAGPSWLIGKENEGLTKQTSVPRQSVKEVHEYMQRQAFEHRRREQKTKKTAELVEERKKRSMLDVIKKQKEARNLTKKQQEKESEVNCQKSRDVDNKGQLESRLFSNRSRTTGHLKHSIGRTGSMKCLYDTQIKTNSLVHLADVNSSWISITESQRHRVEALRKIINSLDERVENETIRLGITKQKVTLTLARPAGDKQAAEGKRIKDNPVSHDENVHEKKDAKISKDQAVYPDVEMHSLQSEQGTKKCTSEQGDHSESTDATSKWSELSELFSRRHFQHHLSLAQSQQFICEEELRARQFSALFRLREKALMERTQAELAWLEHCEKNALSEDDAVTEIKRQQEKVMSRLKQELAEIHHWRNVYKCGRQQRQLLLYHQQDILDIKKSATHFRQVLEEQSMVKTDAGPKVAPSAAEGKSFITKPGITPAARNEDKPPREHRRFFTKAGLRKLLTSEEVWTFGMKRSSGEHYSAEQVNLQKAAPKDQGTDNETKKKVQSSLQKKQPCENVNPSNKSEIHSGEQIQYSARKPFKNEHHFTPEQQKNLDRAPTVSSLSSDIDEDLPYDYEDNFDQPEEQTKAKLQKENSGPDCEKSITDNVTFNVQNSRRSEGALLNNNHEICDESRRTESYTANPQAYEADSASIVSGNLKESVQDKPVTNLVPAVNTDMKRGEESPSCDDSLSEIEDKSEPFSLQSEGLMCSDEERDVLGEEKSDFSLVYAEKFIVVPKSFPYSYQNDPKFNSGDHSHEAAESNLSEILSPVDEILTYGSAELPSVKGGGGSGPLSNSLPPLPPAFEIITWTSEDDPPAPQDFVEDTSINSENVPPLPVDLCLSQKDFRSLREAEDDTNAIFEDKNKTVPPVLTTETDQEDDGSEYTSSLPVDESNESHDPLSSFCIGDKVLVCSSRPGILQYKGHVAFAGGFWAGVALDKPNGNHNGTFRAVKYFTCEKNHGVLVRAEDISHLHREHCSDLDTGADEDTFSDKDPPSDQNGKYMNKPFENNHGRHEDGPGHNFSGSNQMFTQELYENDAPKDNTSAGFSRSNIFDPTSPLKVDHKLVHCNGKQNNLADSGALTERLTGEILADALKNNFRKKEPGSFMTHKPCLMDQWQQGYSVTSPQIQIKPHEHSVVYRLVDLTVEMLCGQENKGALDACDAPKYLADDKGRDTYKKVLFQLASDILHGVCADILEMRGFFQKTVDKSVMSVLQTSHISVEMLKAAVRRETQKVLNLERTDQQMTEMLQTLCKYWDAKRDKVDHILIQELFSEEKQWVDYSTDQITVKFQLAEEIFTLLLDDTISVLNLINIAGNK